MTMLGHTITWGTHIGAERTTGAKGWYAQMKTWWAAHKAARHETKRDALKAHWDARREAVRTPFTVAATDAWSRRTRNQSPWPSVTSAYKDEDGCHQHIPGHASSAWPASL